MSLSSYNPHDRYRQRAARRVSTILTAIFFAAMIFGAGFWIGDITAQQNTYILEQEKRILTEERDALQTQLTEMRAEAQTAMVKFEQLRTNYEDLISEGPMRELVSLLAKQIEQGVNIERLQSIILTARPPQNCSNPESKRFIVQTPVYSGPVSFASIANGTIEISGNGASAQNQNGEKEAWFDPGQPVDLTIKVEGAEPVTKSGLLPLYHSAITNGKEYRFSMTAGNKSFIRVSYDYCDYP